VREFYSGLNEGPTQKTGFYAGGIRIRKDSIKLIKAFGGTQSDGVPRFISHPHAIKIDSG